MKNITKNLNDNIDKKNQYKFLYDMLGSNIVVKDLSQNRSGYNKYQEIEIDPTKEQYLQYTFFNEINLYVKSKNMNQKDSANKETTENKITKIKFFIDTDIELLKQKYNECSSVVNKETDDNDNISEEGENYQFKRNYILYNVYYYQNIISNKNINEEELKIISKDLRNSYTLRSNGDNTYSTDDFFFIICERGFSVCDIKQNSRRFHRFMILYLLTVAYNIKMEKILEEGFELYNTGGKIDIREASKFIENIYAFNLKYFFEFPVKIDRQETLNIWKLMLNNYFVKQKHDEINNQVLDLTKIIIENKNNNFQRNITLAGMVLAFAPIAIELVNVIFKENEQVYKMLIGYVIGYLLIFGIFYGIIFICNIFKKIK